MSEKTLVVIGAGNAGVSLVNELADVPNLKVVVLELKDHFDMTIGNPRAISNEAYASEVLWEWDKVLNGSPEVVQVQQVQEISDGGVRVVLANKQTAQIKADGVVVATGSKYNSSWMKNNEGLNKDEWLAKMTQLRAAIANAKHVMVIGGGVTGVEVAGEIATEFDAKVTVVHKGAWLMNTSESVHRTTMAAIEAVPGTIDVVFNDTVDATETLGEAGPKSYTTAKGRKIEDVSVVLNCVGMSPNTSFLPKEKLDARGLIEVGESLLSPKLSTPACAVWAIGDVTAQGKSRAVVARAMGQALAKNIKSWAQGGAIDKSVYTSSFAPIMASIGRTEGVSSIPFANRFLARALKCADMFQVVSIGVMKIKGMKGFKLSPAALAGPNADAWKVHAQKMGSSVGYWLAAGLVLLCAGGVYMWKQ